ncbi:hypothetical protein GCM10028806_16920 [Spirosoma terrae]|uniref:HD domain-containing protein n=1 Tax=Spirosoma terrae TaxID=1968276 RepID=A0A6L9LA96_9BACT|nr:HD domain-containing protein [Spirosoma terrae]NDU96407.1 HD domain-containing protein [Spirosoma terrae]
MDYQAAEAYILELLRANLPDTLYYHGIHHTLDVVQAAEQLAAAEGVSDDESLALLRTAACFHDAGFLGAYQGHEEMGCEIVREVLPDYGFQSDQIERICSMIMATKIPQSPDSHLAQILCDADLDYLGRDDFEPIADSLFRELKARNLIADLPAWNRVQVKFLENHHYWTASAIAWRQSEKQRHLDDLRGILESDN